MNGDYKHHYASVVRFTEPDRFEIVEHLPSPEQCLLAYWLNLWKKKHREMCGGEFSGAEMFFTE